jgi:hypothetical protein
MANHKQYAAVRALIPHAESKRPYCTIQKAWDVEAGKEVTVVVSWKVDGSGNLHRPVIVMKLMKDPRPEELELLKSEPEGEIMYFGQDAGPVSSKLKGRIMEDRLRLRKGRK